MIGYLAAGFLVPFIARHQQEKSLLDRTLLLTRHGLFFLAIVACSFTWIYAPWLQQLLYHNGSSHNISVMQLCLSVLPAYLLTHIYGSFLTATSRFASFIVVLIISVVINTGLNAWLIPLQGAAGAAKAALVSQYLCAAGCMMYSARQLSLHLSAFGAYIGSAALLLLLFFLADKYDWNVWISLSITIILAGTFIFLQRHKLKKIFTSFQ
jgi:O-antigen/teichoic acid export membrane protein